MSDANLTDSDLANTNLTWADLENAILSGADLFFTALDHTNLKGVNLTNAILGGTTFGDNDLSGAKGLSKIRHWGPSSIGVDTLNKSKSSIPDSFLRGVGVPETFLRNLRSLESESDFYSCFISYASKDQVFAERLYADLQGKGVRCWFAPEDLRIGEKMRLSIEDSVQKHDRLLLVLSKNSVASQWVETEVEVAFEQERIQNRVILMPSRIDNTVMEIGTGWAADIRRTRNMGDFRRWRKNDIYRSAFDRLIRDLMVITPP